MARRQDEDGKARIGEGTPEGPQDRLYRDIARRLMAHGHEIVAYDRDPKDVAALKGAKGAQSLEDFVSKLSAPRQVWVMVPAGAPTEETVQALGKLLSKGDVILDGGMNHCFPATGNFGQLVKKNYPVQNLTRGEAEDAPQELCGPLCTPMDSMARGVKIAEAHEGDLIGFFASGAYSYAASPLLFLSHDTPLELLKFKGETRVARPRMPATRFW